MSFLKRLLGVPMLPAEAPPSLDPVASLPVFVVPDPYEPSYYRAVLLGLHNQARGERPLVLDQRLCTAALEHAGSMARRRKLDHADFPRRAQNWGFRAENAAFGHKEVEAVWFHKQAGWWFSQPHRANALNPSYLKCGFGRSGYYWCAVYGV